MAKPFFTGNYGSALARVDTRPIIEAGRARGQMLANMGAQVGGMIQQYGLNKEKRAKLTGEIEAYYKENPEALSQIGMSGDEAQDKKDFAEREKFVKGDMSMAQLEGYAGKLARGEVLRSKKLQDDARRTLNETNKFNLGLAQELKDANVKLKQNEALTSDIGVAVARMKKEDFEAIRDPALKEKLAQLRELAGVRAAYPASVKARDDRKITQLKIDAAEAMEEAFPASERARLEKKQIKSGIEYKDKYIDYLSGRVDTQIPGNVDIGKEISAVTKEIDDILKSSSLEKDDEGKTLKIEDLIEDVSVSGKITFSKDANKISQREKKRLEDLLGKKLTLTGQAQTTWIDDNGEQRTTTIAEYEEILRKQELEDAAKRQQELKDQAEAEEKILEPGGYGFPFMP